MNQPLWGIDLGGTKIEGTILESIHHPHPIVRTRIDTEASKGYDHLIDQIGRLVEEMGRRSGLRPWRSDLERRACWTPLSGR